MTFPNLGDTVRFTVPFLQSTGQLAGPEPPTSHGPWARGTVVARADYSSGPAVLTVLWEDHIITKALVTNLEIVP